MKILALAVRRAARESLSPDWNLADRVASLTTADDLALLGEVNDEDGEPKPILLVKADPDGEQRLKEALDDIVWIEEGIPHHPQIGGRGGFNAGFQIDVVNTNGDRLRDCRVTVFTESDEGKLSPEVNGRTDWNGSYEAAVHPADRIKQIIVNPIDGHWSAVAFGAASRVVCLPIEYPADRLGWWHRSLGFEAISADQGAGVKIGVIDQGCGQHAALQHVQRIGTFGQNAYDPEDSDDSNHGTHVCGIVSAIPKGDVGFWGIAPGAELYVAAISGTHYQWDIANALRTLVRKHGVDLVNISLGARTRSNILVEAILDAQERGCLCLAAAGNESGPVLWPANFESVVAVSAVGSRWGVPAGTFAAGRIPDAIDAESQSAEFALAHFSCKGPEINCCGPGVGIVSTRSEPFDEEGGWWDMSGTSMASPAVCATLAVGLSRSEEFADLPRDASRNSFIRKVLEEMCESVGLVPHHQGLGMPRVDSSDARPPDGAGDHRGEVR
ncbi:MAG: S8 family serine peptidase [Pirellulaceae bacterium]